MPVAAADGALGIEARHTWNSFTMGDLTVSPHVRIKDIAGLFDLPDIEDNSEPRTEAIGMIEYPSRARARNVTYTVEVRGTTLQELRYGGALLRGAFGPDITTGLNPTRRMVITPHPSYGSQQHTFTARCLTYSQAGDVQDRGERSTHTWVRGVVIGLRLYDPRIYEWNGSVASNAKW